MAENPTTKSMSMESDDDNKMKREDTPGLEANAEQESGPADTKINGHNENETTDQTPQPAATKAEDADTKGTIDTDEMDATPTTPAVANGTPASSKKVSNGSSKKKSSAVPEHKSRKLNKKKSRPMTHLDAKPGQFYLARLKGHQPWPSVICDEAMLPQILLSTRPITTMQADGSFKKPEYEDGGKRAYERTFPIMFLYTNEFAWIPNTELNPLDPEVCKETPEKGKSKSLIEAYKIASQNHPLEHFKGLLTDHMRAMQEDAEAKAEKEAKRAEKAAKAKRKSIDASTAAEADDDEMDIDEAGESKPKTKKRKKEVDSDDDEKPAKTPKAGKLVKVNGPKTPTTEPSSKKKASKPKSSKKTKDKVEGSDEDIDATPKVEEKPLTPAEAKAKKEKLILYYRHKLQRGFLKRDTIPEEDEIKPLSDILAELETHPNLEGSIIRVTKVHKVLKNMIKLPSIPKEEIYNFKKRSHDLLTKWNKILVEDPTAKGDDDKDDDDEKAKPSKSTGEASTSNGVKKDDNAEKEALTAEKEDDAVAPEVEGEKASESKTETTIEGEKKADANAEDSTENEKSAETKKNESAVAEDPDVEMSPVEEHQASTESVEATT